MESKIAIAHSKVTEQLLSCQSNTGRHEMHGK